MAKPYQGEIDSTTCKWTIKNFSLHSMKEDGYCLERSTFLYKTKYGTTYEWRLEAYPHGSEKRRADHIVLDLSRSPFASIMSIEPAFQFSILNKMGDKIYETELKAPNSIIMSPQDAHSPFALHLAHGTYNEKTVILDKAIGLLPNDELTICCDIQHSTKMLKNTTLKKVPDCRIIDDLSSLFEKELFSDVTLSAQGEQFKVHKSILAARSSVFATMFLSDMKEKNQDVIKIVDMGKDVLRAMLSFIYSGKAPGDESLQLTSDLLSAADKYDLQRLKVICEKELCMKVNVDNACDLLIMADLHNASELKATAMDFINNEISTVLTTETRTSLIQNHFSLFNEIFDYHLQRNPKNK